MIGFRTFHLEPLSPTTLRCVLAAGLLAVMAVGGLAAQEAAADLPEPGSELTVYLLTMEPGDEVWQRFGHNALAIADARREVEVAYGWGFFDFRRADFLPRFLKGQMIYLMAGESAARTVDVHRMQNRTVTAQELNLPPSQRRELLGLLERYALPENSSYRYDYFLDNCSTRLRDALDQVLGGQLRAATEGRSGGRSYRFHTRRLTEVDSFLYLGMDTLLSGRGDQPISRWEEMFVPMVVREEIRDLRVRLPGGGETDLVRSEMVLFAAEREPEPAVPSDRLAYLVIGGLAWAGLIAGLARLGTRPGAVGSWGRVGFLLAAGGWSLLVGLVGLILVGCLFTDHQFIHWNENLFHANPLELALAALLPLVVLGGRHRIAAGRLSLFLAALAIVGFVLQVLPGFDQGNGPTIALTLPVHLALAWSLAAGGAGAEAPGSP